MFATYSEHFVVYLEIHDIDKEAPMPDSICADGCSASESVPCTGTCRAVACNKVLGFNRFAAMA